VALVDDFGLQFRHVDLARAVTRTALAADTEVEHLVDELVVRGVVGQVAAHRLAKHVRATPRGRNLLLGGPVRRAHHAAARVLAGATAATAVAEFDHPLEAVLVGPVEFGVEARVELVLGVEAEVLRHRDVATDLAGVEQPVRVEGRLQVAERAPEVVAVQFPVPLGARASVAVFAGDAPTELDDHVGDAVGDVLHRREAWFGLHVHQRAYVEDAGAGVGVERRERVVVVEDLVEPRDELGEVFGRDGAVFDEREVLGVARPAEQDGEPGLPEFPVGRALLVVVGLQRVEGEAVFVPASVANAVGDEVGGLLAAVRVVLGVELHEQRGPSPRAAGRPRRRTPPSRWRGR